MNTNSIETQQNAFTQQEHKTIAEIYQRMLLGDKSALSNLQKVKIKSPKHTHVQNIKLNNQQFSHRQKHVPSFDKQQTYHQSNKQTKDAQKVNNNRKIFQQQLSQSKSILNSDKQKSKNNEGQKQKFRNYIKNKVNDLRSQKQGIKKIQQKQFMQTNKINDKVQIGKITQSKSYDLVKNKKTHNQNTNQVNIQIFPIPEQNKNQIHSENVSVKSTLHEATENKFRKVQSSTQNKINKILPPLKRRVPTQTSQNNSRIGQQKITQRQITTPINLANSNIKVQLLQNKQRAKSRVIKEIGNHTPLTKQNSIIQSNQSKIGSTGTISSKKPGQNKQKVKKISLPQMKKQRQQFYLINQQQKASQTDIVKYHQQTKNFIQQIKQRYSLNFKNQNRLTTIKQFIEIQPVSMKLDNSKRSKSHKQQSKQQSAEGSKKKIFDVIQEKIIQSYNDINLIEQQISKKKKDVNYFQNVINSNIIIQFWKEHDLQTYDFQDSIDDIPQIQQEDNGFEPQMRDSQIDQAYSTAMPSVKDKKWKSKIIKQYDTNRSFQQYAKSRSKVKESQLLKHNLNKIEQSDEGQQYGNNKVVVNSRLKNLLLM